MNAVVELTRNVTLIHRWHGHGDLTIVTRGGRVYLRADQVEQLAGIPPWAGGESLLGDTFPLELEGNPYYDVDEAIARCETADTSTAAAFLTWLNDSLEQLLTDEVLDLAQGIPGFIGSYPVRVAARILDQDPAISIGQNSLFTLMHLHGWIERDQHDDWTITLTARRNGWLTIRDVTIPAQTKTHRRAYPQIYITPAGLTELATILHGLHQPIPDAPPPPTLFD